MAETGINHPPASECAGVSPELQRAETDLEKAKVDLIKAEEELERAQEEIKEAGCSRKVEIIVDRKPIFIEAGN
jgi:hypothetical protein